ncbi:hypothetical protein [Streptomyces sp. NPDC002164]
MTDLRHAPRDEQGGRPAARGEARNPGQALVGVVCGAAGAVLALLLAFIA